MTGQRAGGPPTASDDWLPSRSRNLWSSLESFLRVQMANPETNASDQSAFLMSVTMRQRAGPPGTPSGYPDQSPARNASTTCPRIGRPAADWLPRPWTRAEPGAARQGWRRASLSTSAGPSRCGAAKANRLPQMNRLRLNGYGPVAVRAARREERGNEARMPSGGQASRRFRCQPPWTAPEKSRPGTTLGTDSTRSMTR